MILKILADRSKYEIDRRLPDAFSMENYMKYLLYPIFQNYWHNRVVEDVEPIFLSTYPTHTSMITGKYPKDHGVFDNTFFDREIGPR